MRSSAPYLAALPLVLGLAGWPALSVAAATCKYIDAEGRVTFANVPIKDARRVLCFDPVPDRPTAPKPGVNAPSRRASPDASSNVRVDPDTQRRRDLDRRRILEEELGDERSLLERASRVLADLRAEASPQSQDRLRTLQETVARHAKNIEAIQRELGSVR
jgi:hypothetical protein